MISSFRKYFILFIASNFRFHAVEGDGNAELPHSFAKRFMVRMKGARHMAYAKRTDVFFERFFHFENHIKIVMLENAVIAVYKADSCVKNGKIGAQLFYCLNLGV